MFDFIMDLIYGSDLFTFLADKGVDELYIPLLFVVAMVVCAGFTLYLFICFMQFILSILNRRKQLCLIFFLLFLLVFGIALFISATIQLDCLHFL